MRLQRQLLFGVAALMAGLGAWRSRQIATIPPTATTHAVSETSPPARNSLTPAPVSSEFTNADMTAGRRTGAPPVTPEPAAPELLDRVEFERLAEQTLSALPTRTDLARLSPDDMHGFPSLLREAGASLGKISQAVHEQPELAPAALHFYRSCFAKDDLPDPVRALCLADFRHLHQAQAPGAAPADETDAPAQVRRLARLIPSGW